MLLTKGNMKEPRKPSNEECCNSGCNPCIFDVYEKQLVLYKKYLEHNVTLPTYKENAISQLDYRPFIVVEHKIICEAHKLIVFRNKCIENEKVWWKPGNYFLIKYTSHDTQFTRPYTPLKLEDVTYCDYDFAIIIKKYETGVVSNYLYDLVVGMETLWRGPYGTYEMTPNKLDRITMIAQGTGIAPFISIIEDILNNEDDMTKLILFYCCPSIDKILFRNKLYSLKSYWNFSYQIYISSTNLNLDKKYQEPLKNQRLDKHDFYKLKPIKANDQFLVCGSEEFMDYYKSALSADVFEGNFILFNK